MNEARLLKIKECISILEPHIGDGGIIREAASYVLSAQIF